MKKTKDTGIYHLAFGVPVIFFLSLFIGADCDIKRIPHVLSEFIDLAVLLGAIFAAGLFYRGYNNRQIMFIMCFLVVWEQGFYSILENSEWLMSNIHIRIWSSVIIQLPSTILFFYRIKIARFIVIHIGIFIPKLRAWALKNLEHIQATKLDAYILWFQISCLYAYTIGACVDYGGAVIPWGLGVSDYATPYLQLIGLQDFSYDTIPDICDVLTTLIALTFYKVLYDEYKKPDQLPGFLTNNQK